MRGLRGRRVVTDPDGLVWAVGIRWLPRRPRWLGWGGRTRTARRRDDDGDGGWLDAGAAGLDAIEGVGGLGGIGAALALVLLVVVFWFAVIPLAVLVLDILFVVVLTVGAVAGRVLFRRPWTVEAVAGDERISWSVVGFAASRRSVLEAAEALAAGEPVPPCGVGSAAG